MGRNGKRFIPYQRGPFTSTGSAFMLSASDIHGSVAANHAYKALYVHTPTGARSALSLETIRRTLRPKVTGHDRQGNAGAYFTRGNQFFIDR